MARNYDNPADRPIGSTFTASIATGNTKSYVVANGQILNKSDYPELAQVFSQSQTFENIGDIASASSTTGGNLPFLAPGSNYRLNTDSTSTYTVHAQSIFYATTANGYGCAVWSTFNGDDWRLMYGDISSGEVKKVCAIGTDVFVCCNGALFRTTDGITLTKVMNSGVYDICFNGTTYLIVTSGGTAISTTDFVNFTPVTGIPNTPTGCVYFGTNFVVISSSSNSVFYSSNLTSWSTSPSTGYTLNENFVRVVNNLFVVFPSSNGNPLFVYSSDPTTSSWNNSARTYNTSSHGLVCGMIYDPATTTYVVSVARTQTSVWGYVFTSIGSSGTSYTTTSTVVNASDSIVYMSGSNKYRGLSYHFTTKTTTWTTGTIDITSTDNIANPFFVANQIGIGRGGTTFSGNRYITKATGDTSSTVYQSAMVEVNGVFKALSQTSQSYISSTSTNALQSGVIYEDSAGYVWFGQSNSSNYYWATFNSSRTLLSQNSGSSPGATTVFSVPVRNRGIELHEYASASSRSVYLLTTQNTSANIPVSFSYSLNTTSTVYHISVSYATDEIVTFELNATPSTSPSIYVLKNGSLQFKASVIAINSSGSTVSFTNTSKIWKVGGLFYCNIGGTLFSSNNGVVFNQIGFVQSISSSNRTTTVEYASGLAIGGLQSRALGNGSATMTIALDNSLSQGTIASFFKLNNDTAFTTSTGSGMTSLLYKTPMNTSTQFIVPYLPATSINQTNCIVAR